MALGGAQLLEGLKRCPKVENQQNSILEIIGHFKYGQRPMQFINFLEFFKRIANGFICQRIVFMKQNFGILNWLSCWPFLDN